MQRLGKNVSQRKRRFAWRVTATVAFIILLIAALLIAAILKARQDGLAQARLEASYLSAALAQDVEGFLATIAVASEFVRGRVEAEGDAAPLNEFEQEMAKYIPHLISISVIGRDGRLQATSGDVASMPSGFSHFEFFIASWDSAGSGLRVGKPLRGILAGQVITPFTQRLENKEGAFAGVVLFSTDPARATALYHRVDLGQSGSLMIAGTDGTIFAGYTLPRGLDPSLFGTPFGGKEIIARFEGAPSGSYIAGGPPDGIERIYAWRRLEAFPLIALVGLGKSEALAAANRQAILMLGLGLLSIVLLLALIGALSREISRRIKQAVALEAHRQKLKDTNAELAAAKREAQQANRSKSLFLANIGHELRTPLTAIIGFAEIIRDQVFGQDPDRYAEYGSDIYRSATHLLRLIGNLLDWSKIEAGKFELHEDVLDLSEIEEECLRLVRGQAENAGVELSVKPERAALSLKADATALKQILLNLFANAIKFTPKGGSVWLDRTLGADGSLTLSVADSGIGMREDEIQKALEPFEQVQSAAVRHHEGTGLGLPLAVQLMELHGGSLSIESQPGQGTTVSLHFPAWRVNPDHPASLDPPGQSHDPGPTKKVSKPAKKH